MNDMAEDLRKHGYSSSLERIINIARDAWAHVKFTDWNGNLARHRYVRDRLAGEMTFEMMQEWQPKALNDAIKLLLESTDPSHGGSVVGFLPAGRSHLHADTQLRGAPAISSPDPAQAGGGGHYIGDTHDGAAPAANDAPPSAERRSEPAKFTTAPIAISPAAPFNGLRPVVYNKQTHAARQAERMAGRVEAEKAMSRLETIMVVVNGELKPLGKCTVGEVRAWAAWTKRQQRIQVQFAERLVSNCDSNMIVGEIWKGKEKEVENLYAETEADNAA